MDIEMAIALKNEAERHLKRAKGDIEKLRSQLKSADREIADLTKKLNELKNRG